MKQIILLIIIFVLGGVAYAFLNPLLLSLLQKEVTPPQAEDTLVSTTSLQTEIVPVATQKEEIEEDTITIAPDGSQLDGPFLIFDAQGNETEATVQIVRSPEETLLQFEDFTEKHSVDSDIYFSTDLKATSYLTLGFAKLQQGVSVYGIPLDADLSKYKYILIYDVRNKTTEYYAKIN